MEQSPLLKICSASLEIPDFRKGTHGDFFDAFESCMEYTTPDRESASQLTSDYSSESTKFHLPDTLRLLRYGLS